jgi:hypothetical protein
MLAVDNPILSEFKSVLRSTAPEVVSLRRAIAMAREMGLKDPTDRELEEIVIREASTASRPVLIDRH